MASEKPHIVCIPYPAQGHVTPMLKLAKLLHSKGFHITFVNTEFNHRRLLKSRGPSALDGLPDFRFATIPDGLPPSNEDATQDIPSLCNSTMTTCLPHFRRLLSVLKIRSLQACAPLNIFKNKKLVKENILNLHPCPSLSGSPSGSLSSYPPVSPSLPLTAKDSRSIGRHKAALFADRPLSLSLSPLFPLLYFLSLSLSLSCSPRAPVEGSGDGTRAASVVRVHKPPTSQSGRLPSSSAQRNHRLGGGAVPSALSLSCLGHHLGCGRAGVAAGSTTRLFLFLSSPL